MNESARADSESNAACGAPAPPSDRIDEGCGDSPPRVFVVTACRDSEGTIAETLESVVNQSDRLTRYVVIDGASTDSTLQIVDRYAARLREKLELVSEPDRGIYDAMNKGIRRCLAEAGECDLIATLNSDDQYKPGALEKVSDAARRLPDTDVFFGDVEILDSSGCPTGRFRRSAAELTREACSDGMPIEHQTMFVRSRVYFALGLYDESLAIAADYDFVLRLVDGHVSSKHVGAVLVGFRMGGVSTSFETASLKEAIRVRVAHGANPLFEWARYCKRRAFGHAYSVLKWIPGVTAAQVKFGAKATKDRESG